MHSKVGVVILNYNSKKLTVDLANKISKYPSIDTIVVVDNNSSDEFKDCDFLSTNIHYIKSKSNNGYATGNNIGLKYLIEQCDCEYAFIANPDVEFFNETILSITNKFKLDENLALCSSFRYGYKGEKIHQYFEFQSFSNALANCFFITRRMINKNKVINQVNRIKYNINKIIYVDAVPGAFFGIRSSFLKKINYLYEGTFLYYEEFFVGQSAKKLGYKSAIASDCVYHHNHKLEILSKSNIRMFYEDRKSMMLYFKYFKILNTFQLLVLYISIVLGTFEYIMLYYLYGFIKKVRSLK